MARKLDRKLPFGEIYGGGEACFEQHGIQFDGEGNELPGFKDVEIPESKTVYIVSDDVPQLQTLICELQAKLDNQQLLIADLEAEKEEMQGKVDTLQIDCDKLVEQLAAVNAGTKKGKKEEAAPVQTEIEDQLKAQGV